MSYKDYEYAVKDMTLEDFTAFIAMMLVDPYAIKLGLLLCSTQKHSMFESVTLSCQGSEELADGAIKDLIRVKFMSREKRRIH